MGHVARYFSIIGETLQRWGKRIIIILVLLHIGQNIS